MKRAVASKRSNFTGIYLRGKIFWFTCRLNGEKKFESLETTDYGEAGQKALVIRQNPELAPAAVFAQEIEAFVRAKVAANEYSPRSAETKIHALKEFAVVTGRANLVNVTTADVTKLYSWLQGREPGRPKGKVVESTAQGYIVTARSFFNWLVDAGKIRHNPVAAVQLDRHDPKAGTSFAPLFCGTNSLSARLRTI